MSDCGKYLIIYLSTDDLENQLYYVDLEQNGEIKGKMSVQPIVTEINGGFAVSRKMLKNFLCFNFFHDFF